MVSAQFCINYMFDTEQSVLNLLKNITERLVDKGKVILTFPDAGVIVKKLREKGTKTDADKTLYMNKHFAIEIDQLQFPKDSKYGLDYNFFLQDAVGEKDENSNFVFLNYL